MGDLSKLKRTKMENLVFKVFNALDPTGKNAEYYREMFESMNDIEFDKFMKKLLYNKGNSDDEQVLILQVVDYENDLKIGNAEAAAKVLGIPLYEYVVVPNQSADPEHPFITQHPVLVGPITIKAMQQKTFKKNSTSVEASKRNKFNQTTGKDKNGRASDIENYALAVVGSKNVSKEFMSARADDQIMKSEFTNSIIKNGFVSLNSLTDKVENKTTLNFVNVYFMGMQLKTDLVDTSMMLRYTSERKK